MRQLRLSLYRDHRGQLLLTELLLPLCPALARQGLGVEMAQLYGARAVQIVEVEGCGCAVEEGGRG